MIESSEAVELKPYQNLAYQLLKAGAQVIVEEYLQSDEWFACHFTLSYNYEIDIDPDRSDGGNGFVVTEHDPQLLNDFNLLMDSGIATTVKRYRMVLISEYEYNLTGDDALLADELLYQASLKKQALDVQHHKAVMDIYLRTVYQIGEIKKG